MKLLYIENGTIDFDDLKDSEKSFLPYYELKKISCYKHKNDRNLHFLSKWLLYQFMQDAGYPASTIHKISYDKFQKPYMTEFPFHFSFSHSGKIAVLAISEKQKVGVDIEQIPNQKLPVIPDIFSEQEKVQLIRNEDNTSYFFRVWTAKESILKAFGKGFDLNFKELNTETDEIRWHNKRWFVHSCSLRDDYVCSIASPKKMETIDIQELRFN